MPRKEDQDQNAAKKIQMLFRRPRQKKIVTSMAAFRDVMKFIYGDDEGMANYLRIFYGGLVFPEVVQQCHGYVGHGSTYKSGL